MRIHPVLPLLFALTSGLTACAHNTDFIAKLNAEPLGNTNQANIAAMVANPTDLVRGHGVGPADGAVSVLPIQRFEADHAKGLGGASSGGGAATGG
jgi:type IV pilus biogenesis protein CpaD/CtpE